MVSLRALVLVSARPRHRLEITGHAPETGTDLFAHGHTKNGQFRPSNRGVSRRVVGHVGANEPSDSNSKRCWLPFSRICRACMRPSLAPPRFVVSNTRKRPRTWLPHCVRGKICQPREHSPRAPERASERARWSLNSLPPSVEGGRSLARSGRGWTYLAGLEVDDLSVDASNERVSML